MCTRHLSNGVSRGPMTRQAPTYINDTSFWTKKICFGIQCRNRHLIVHELTYRLASSPTRSRNVMKTWSGLHIRLINPLWSSILPSILMRNCLLRSATDFINMDVTIFPGQIIPVKGVIWGGRQENHKMRLKELCEKGVNRVADGPFGPKTEFPGLLALFAFTTRMIGVPSFCMTGRYSIGTFSKSS